jgi:hypothetical protein
MRCLSPEEAEATFSSPKFSVSLEHQWYRSALQLDRAYASRQTRIAAEQPDSLGAVPYFAMRLNRWLPARRSRLLWVDHWETMTFFGAEALVAATWRGLGEARSFKQAPGLYLDPQDWDEEDQTTISSTHAAALGALVGVIALVMMTYSDGWLISEGCADRIEFWEGHFFFHSHDPMQLERGGAIIDSFGCKRWQS